MGTPPASRASALAFDTPSPSRKPWMGDRVKLTASLVGRNLWMIYCKAPFDPELTASTGSYLQGIDYFMQPSLRSLGFNVQLKF